MNTINLRGKLAAPGNRQCAKFNTTAKADSDRNQQTESGSLLPSETALLLQQQQSSGGVRYLYECIGAGAAARMEGSKAYEAIKANDADMLKTLLVQGHADLAQRDSEGRGFLHHAVLSAASHAVLQALLEGGADLAVRDSHGRTAMDVIASGSYADVVRDVLGTSVKYLILEAKEEEAHRLLMAGWSHWPITAEEAKQKSEKAAQLLARLIKLQNKVHLVHAAVKEGRVKELKDLLDNKHLETAADWTGLLPLHKAVLYRQREIVEFFITNFKTVLTAKDHMGRSALHYAAAMPDDGNLYRVLKAAGAEDTGKDLVGKTPSDYNIHPADLPIETILKRLEESSKSHSSTHKLDESAEDREINAEAKLVDSSCDKAMSEDGDRVKTQAGIKKTSGPLNPAEVTPNNMYVTNRPRHREPPPSTIDGKYVAEHLGTALTLALAEIAEKRPWDPIEYLGHWLHNYRKSLDETEKQRKLLEQIISEEEEAIKENTNRLKRLEEQKRLQEEEMRKKEEEQKEKTKKKEEERQRQAKEAALAQKPQLPTVTEEAAEDIMFRERDEAGQTELHILATRNGADLVTLINLGYSLADRDADNKTARDVAEDNELTENVEVIDNYVTNLLEQENLESLNQLILDGYDKLNAVFEKVSTDGLPESVTSFIKSIPQLQGQVEATFEAVLSGVEQEVEKALERPELALTKDKYGRSPLHVAILANQIIIAKYIAQNFPLANKARDNLNRTPLHYAAALSDELAESLKSYGADVNAKDARKHTPMYYKGQKDEIIKLKETMFYGQIRAPKERVHKALDREPNGDQPDQDDQDDKEPNGDQDDQDDKEPTTEDTARA